MVLQWHVLGMYIPSFFSGFLIKRLEKKWLIVLGILIMTVQAVISMLGFEFGLASVATYGAGFLENRIGWFAMNVMILPILALALLASFDLLRPKTAASRRLGVQEITERKIFDGK